MKGKRRPSSQNLVQESTSAFELACSGHKRCISLFKALLRIMAIAMQSRIVAAMCPAAAARSVVQPSSVRSLSAFGLRAAPRTTSRSGARPGPGTSCLHQIQQASTMMHGKEHTALQTMHTTFEAEEGSCLQPTSWFARMLTTLLRTLTQPSRR